MHSQNNLNLCRSLRPHLGAPARDLHLAGRLIDRQLDHEKLIAQECGLDSYVSDTEEDVLLISRISQIHLALER